MAQAATVAARAHRCRRRAHPSWRRSRLTNSFRALARLGQRSRPHLDVPRPMRSSEARSCSISVRVPLQRPGPLVSGLGVFMPAGGATERELLEDRPAVPAHLPVHARQVRPRWLDAIRVFALIPVGDSPLSHLPVRPVGLLGLLGESVPVAQLAVVGHGLEGEAVSASISNVGIASLSRACSERLMRFAVASPGRGPGGSPRRRSRVGRPAALRGRAAPRTRCPWGSSPRRSPVGELERGERHRHVDVCHTCPPASSRAAMRRVSRRVRRSL